MKAKEIMSVRNVLSNPLRYRVFEAIARRPCSTREQIAESLGAHVGVVGFHVRALTAHGAVGICAGGKLTADPGGDDFGEGARK